MEVELVASAPDLAGRTPDDELESHEAMQDLEHALGELPARQREALARHLVRGQSLKCAGRAMGIGPDRVSKLCGRGLYRGAQMLAGE